MTIGNLCFQIKFLGKRKTQDIRGYCTQDELGPKVKKKKKQANNECDLRLV